MQTQSRIRQNLGEIIGGLLLAALGAVWAVTSIGYGVVGDGGRLAPGTVPFGAGVILVLCGVAICIKGAVSGANTSPEHGEVTGVAAADEAAAALPHTPSTQSILARTLATPRTNPVLTVFALVTAGVIAMPLLGFSLAFAITIFLILIIVERQRALRSLLIAAITAGCGFVLFEVIFRLPLPTPFFL